MARKKKTVTPEDVETDNIEVVVAKRVDDAPIVAEALEAAESAEAVEAAESAEAVEAAESAEAVEAAESAEAVEAAESAEAVEAAESAVAVEAAESAVAVEAAESAEAVEAAESTEDEEITDEADSPSPSDFMNVEHFADYRRRDEVEPVEQITEDAITDEAATTDNEAALIDEKAVVEDGEPAEDEYREYENLTILDEIEEESERDEPSEKDAVPKDEVPYDKQKPRRVDARFDFVELFVCMMALIMLLSAFVFRHSVVDGGSMESTLLHGEHLIISNFFYEPEQYDIIVCEDYSTGLKKPIIKRVIATEGQTVLVVSMDEVYVDGKLVDTSFVLIDGKEDPIYESRYPIECVVPEGEVFVMGDHRNSSLDSRILGTIDEDTILGKVVLRFYPFDRFGKVE